MLANRILEGSTWDVLIIGRREAAGVAAVQEAASRHGDHRVLFRRADACEPTAVADAVRDAQVVIIALAESRYLEAALEGALLARVPYTVDVLIGPGRQQVWERLGPRFEANDLVGITEVGVQPGLPGILLRRALAEVPDAQWARVAAALRIRIPPRAPMPDSVLDLVSQFGLPPTIYQKGRPARAWLAYAFPYRFVRFDAFGRQAVAPMPLPEVRAVAARHRAVRHIEFAAGGLNAVATWVALPVLAPLVMLLGRWLRGPLARVLYYGVLRPFSRPPFGAALRVEAANSTGQRFELEIHGEDEYGLTADAVLVLLHQLERGKPARGVTMMAELVEPRRYLEALEQETRRPRIPEHPRP